MKRNRTAMTIVALVYIVVRKILADKVRGIKINLYVWMVAGCLDEVEATDHDSHQSHIRDTSN